jgi:hypothetical protein
MAQMLSKSLSTVEKTIRRQKKDKIIERVGSEKICIGKYNKLSYKDDKILL